MKGIPLLSDRSGSFVFDSTPADGDVAGPPARCKGGYVYVDNLGALGLVVDDVRATVADISEQLGRACPTTHEQDIKNVENWASWSTAPGCALAQSSDVSGPPRGPSRGASAVVGSELDL